MAGGNVAPERRLVFGVGEVSSQPARPRRFSFGGLPRSEIFILEKDAQPAASTGRPLEWQVFGVRIGVNIVCKGSEVDLSAHLVCRGQLGQHCRVASSVLTRSPAFTLIHRARPPPSSAEFILLGQPGGCRHLSRQPGAAEIGLVVVKRIP
jgi:hypothetical protein